MARRLGTRAQLRIFGALLLLALGGGGTVWWQLRHWLPERELYPVQGIEIGADDGKLAWASLKAIGAGFAYIDASASAFARDALFARNFKEARAEGLPVGAVHRYDPCQPADKQAANFVIVVPRNPELLPPAVELDMLADDCPVKITDAAVESELMTFINQVETHTGKPVLLKLSPAFEHRYGMAARIDRNLWLVQDRLQPDYAGRPWTMWTANSALANEVSSEGLRWVVVRP
jgi:lysozyme